MLVHRFFLYVIGLVYLEYWKLLKPFVWYLKFGLNFFDSFLLRFALGGKVQPFFLCLLLIFAILCFLTHSLLRALENLKKLKQTEQSHIWNGNKSCYLRSKLQQCLRYMGQSPYLTLCMKDRRRFLFVMLDDLETWIIYAAMYRQVLFHDKHISSDVRKFWGRGMDWFFQCFMENLEVDW